MSETRNQTQTPLTEKYLPFEDFLNTFSNQLERNFIEAFPPLVEKPERMNQPVLRMPLAGQVLPINAVTQSIKTNFCTSLVGEMGCGKTAISLFAVNESPQVRKVLVICPSHLPTKWKNEIQKTIPNTEVSILHKLGDIDKYRNYKVPAGKRLFLIISKEKAKLGARWEAAYKLHRGFIKCPSCYAKKRNPQGDPITLTDLVKKRHFCDGCGEALFTVTPKPRRYPLAQYMGKRMKRYFDLFIVDEEHEFANESAQGAAVGQLVNSSKKLVTLTGTKSGGYSSSIFYNMQRFTNSLRPEFNYEDKMEFIRKYGILETTTKEKDEHIGDGSASKRKIISRESKEKPGISPVILEKILPSTIFIKLSDIADQLPQYSEHVVTIPMSQRQSEQYAELRNQMTAVVKKLLRSGSKRALGSYIQSLLYQPDRPWANEYHDLNDSEQKDNDLIVDVPGLELTDTVAKDEALLDLVKQELSAGRKCLVYVEGTETRDIMTRYQEMFENHGFKVAPLRSKKIKPDKRQAWISEREKDGTQIIICHPKTVATGLDILGFPSIFYTQSCLQVLVLRQAARRSFRIGQMKPVKVFFLALEETLQMNMLSLTASKIEASLALEGDIQDTGITEYADDNIMLALAKSLLNNENVQHVSNITGDIYEQDYLRTIDVSNLGVIAELVDADCTNQIQANLFDSYYESISKNNEQKTNSYAITTTMTVKIGRKKEKIPTGTSLLFPELFKGEQK